MFNQHFKQCMCNVQVSTGFGPAGSGTMQCDNCKNYFLQAPVEKIIIKTREDTRSHEQSSKG